MNCTCFSFSGIIILTPHQLIDISDRDNKTWDSLERRPTNKNISWIQTIRVIAYLKPLIHFLPTDQNSTLYMTDFLTFYISH